MLPPLVEEKKAQLYDYLQQLDVDTQLVNNESLMILAFVHKSYAADYNGDFEFNERLEFLGDAILSAIVARLLYEKFPERAESDLTLYKIALVRAETLAEVAQDIGLDKTIFLGKGEEKNGGRQKVTILCDCLEALLGYLYIDIGADVVEKLIKKHILTKLDHQTQLSVKSYKSHLQELIQKQTKITPHYVEKEIGKDPATHEFLYQSDVYRETEHLGTGVGTNKKKAQEAAAKDAFEKLQSQ